MRLVKGVLWGAHLVKGTSLDPLTNFINAEGQILWSKQWAGLRSVISGRWMGIKIINEVLLIGYPNKRIAFNCKRWIWLRSRPTGNLKLTDIQCLSPAKKYKLYKSSINKSIHFAQRRLSSSTRGQRVTAQLNLSREWKNRMTTVVISAILNPVSRVSTPH